ncbi:MAG: FkbM family methyltransferase, partial [Caldilineaceae bacterium]|nr:FkbM family methyltransferase [Caldilineaceae bacterium]
AIGAQSGQASMLVSARTPTVSTLSQSWANEVTQSESFSSVQWETSVSVTVTTLDHLVGRYGIPAFCKIDVEGYELEALLGLTQPLPALSFEFVTAAPEVALGCLERLQTLASYEYNWSRGERHQWESGSWISGAEMAMTLRQMPVDGGSGDIYARRLD